MPARSTTRPRAVEVAWLRLFADAGCFTDEEQATAVTRVADYTGRAERDLATAGYYDGPVDGVYGPTTVDAVKALQTESDLPATGFVDHATATALDDKLVALGDDQDDAGGCGHRSSRRSSRPAATGLVPSTASGRPN